MAEIENELTREERIDWLKNEYNIVDANWRSFGMIRFALLVFATTWLSILIGAYQHVWVNAEKLEFLGKTALFVIPVFGILSTIAIYLIEDRTFQMRQDCFRRAEAIEDKLGFKDGHFHSLRFTPLKVGFASHGLPVALIHFLIGVAWAYLLLAAFYPILK